MRSEYEERYRLHFHDKRERYVCFYCGEPAPTLDHVPPVSRVPDYESIGLASEWYLKVPCCQECNSIAGNSLQENIFERADYIGRQLSRKYARHIRAPEWSDSEIASLGRAMRTAVIIGQRERERAIRRTEYALGVQSLRR